jgi:hypothetical protein
MRSWHELAQYSVSMLAKVDVAEINLACAQGLPGSERMDPQLCFRRISEMACLVESETRRKWHFFAEHPEHYSHSEEFFRVLLMITVLQRDCGVKYNPAKIPHDAPFYPEDTFIFGIFQGDGGTCASLPVLWTAVGQRLGYPIKLVSNLIHGFARWDDPPDGLWFNIEATARGLSTPPNRHYREGMYAKTAAIEERAGNLLSLTPRRMLAHFLRERSLDWWEHGYFRNAVNCLAWYAELDGYPFSLGQLDLVTRDWYEELVKRMPFKVEEPRFKSPPRTFHLIPLELEARMIALGILDDLLRQYCVFAKKPRWAGKLPLIYSAGRSSLGVFECDRHWRFIDEFKRWCVAQRRSRRL